MKFDLCFVLVDLGVPWYKQAASEMIRSARRAYKDHDMRVVQLSDSKTDPHPDADGVFGFKTDVVTENLCQFKGHAIATYALQADRPVIFCDVDLLWQNDKLIEWGAQAGVACMFRHDMPSMPINTGVIWTQAGETPFWTIYRVAVDDLPTEMQGWWGDQAAMTAAWLTAQEQPYMHRWDMSLTAPAPDTLPEKPLDTPAVHFKGARKSLMIPYARMLDKGGGFDFVRPSEGEIREYVRVAARQSAREAFEGPNAGWTF